MNALGATTFPQNVRICAASAQQHGQRLHNHISQFLLPVRHRILSPVLIRRLPRLQKLRIPVQTRHEHLQQPHFPIHVLEYGVVLQDVKESLHGQRAAVHVSQTVRFEEYRHGYELFAGDEGEIEH